MKIYPSLISSDLLDLQNVIAMLDSVCDGYHIDVMDDHFVPNLTWGPAFVQAIATATKRPLHIHLMVDNPARWVERLPLSARDVFVFHWEAVASLAAAQQLIALVTDRGMQAGVALRPQTPIEEIFSILPLVHHVLVMSVNPGFSGQNFMPDVIEKIPLLVAHRAAENLSFDICMDGGIGLENIKMLASTGVDQVGVASAIFATDDPVAACKELREAAQ